MKPQGTIPSPYSQLSSERSVALAQTGGGRKPRFNARAHGIGFFDDEIEKPLIDIDRNPGNIARSEGLRARDHVEGIAIAVKELGTEAIDLFVNRISPAAAEAKREAQALYAELLGQTTALFTGAEESGPNEPEKPPHELAAIEHQRAIIQAQIERAKAQRDQTEVLYYMQDTSGQRVSAEALGYQGNYEGADSIYALAAGRAKLLETIETADLSSSGEALNSPGNSVVRNAREFMAGNRDNNGGNLNAG